MKKEIEVDVQMCVRQNSCSDKFGKIQTKALLTEPFLIKSLTWCRCFLVNFAKFFRWLLQFQISVNKI